MSAKDRIGVHFTTRYQEAPAARVRVPSRLNLVGEHTDYNNGFVLPLAMDREMWFAVRPRADQTVHLRSESYVAELVFDLNRITKGAGWGEYVKGVAWALSESGRELQGWDGFLASDIPMGAGISSSAALSIGSAVAFAVVSGFFLETRQLAEAVQRAENDWVGVRSGIMDPLVMAGAHSGHAQLIDCRDLSADDIPIPPGVVLAIMDTGTRRAHVDSAYNQRHAECLAAARHYEVASLRDLDMETLESNGAGLSDLIYRRARHVVTENERTLRAAEALRAGDVESVGRLMTESHESLRDDYEVSSLPLDAMVTAATEVPGCFGSRLMGGGFGGVTVALVDRRRGESFKASVAESFGEMTGLQAHVHLVKAVDGVVALPGPDD